MTAPTFEVLGCEVRADHAQPSLDLRLEISDPDPEALPLQALDLRCQVRVLPESRSYGPEARARLAAIFTAGRAEVPLPALHWATVPLGVRAFRGETTATLNLPCPVEAHLATGRYLFALEAGAVPLRLLFSGMIMRRREDQSLVAEPMSWSREARFDLPVETYQDAIERYYPNQRPVLVSTETFRRMEAFQAAQALPSWEAALDRLLSRQEAEG